MRLVSSDAILLEIRNLADHDQIVSLLTPEHGRKSGVARGSKRKFSRYAGQLQPLARLQVTWFEREGRELVRLRDVNLVRSAEYLRSSLEDILLGSYLAEHAQKLTEEADDDQLFYRLLDRCLQALEEGVDRSLVARYYEAWSLRLTGVFPAPIECPTCGGLLSEKGAILPRDEVHLECSECHSSQAGDERVSREVLAFLVAMSSRAPATMAELNIEARCLASVEELCRLVRRRFLGFELKSYLVMRETLESAGPPAISRPPAADAL